MGTIEHKSRSFKDLEVWRQSIQFAKDVYRLTEKFPSHELYGLTSQVRKAVVSIPFDIAEGQCRNSSKEFRHYLAMALGSLGEVETQLIISKEIDYLTQAELDYLQSPINDIRKMIMALSRKIA
jgi:four helix bundle protein